MKPFKIINSYVYIVLEHHTDENDAKVHGVYINKDEAEGKAHKLRLGRLGDEPKNKGYISVLKKPVLGKERIKHDSLIWVY